jgi:hypothetical protein
MRIPKWVQSLKRLQNGMKDAWLRESLTEKWIGLDRRAPVPRPTARISVP